jgi:hypothetical protein
MLAALLLTGRRLVGCRDTVSSPLKFESGTRVVSVSMKGRKACAFSVA